MVGFGLRSRQTSRVVDNDAKTPRKHYNEELDTGQIRATVTTAAIFWHATRGS